MKIYPRITIHKDRVSGYILPFYYRFLLIQILISVIFFLLLWSSLGVLIAYSGLCGSTVGIIPNAYLAYKALRITKNRNPKTILYMFYIGEAGKIALTGVLFSLTFIYIRPISPSATFGVFMLTQLTTWVTLLFSGTKTKTPRRLRNLC